MPRGRVGLTFDDFVRKAEAVHGSRFDYSRVKYVNSKTKVEIGCPLHGYFWQTPEKHWLGHGCPHKDCINAKLEATNLNKRGVRRPLQSKESMLKYELTSMDRYGFPNPSMSPEVSAKRRSTCLDRFGVEYSCQSEHNRILREQTNTVRYGGISPFCSEKVRAKAQDTIEVNHGVRNVLLLPETWDKIRATNMRKRGVPYPLMSPEVQEKSRMTIRRKFGTDVYLASEDAKVSREKTLQASHGVSNPMHIPEVVAQVSDTKRRNGTFSTFKAEWKLYDILKLYFGEDDVVHIYNSDVRYPFAVDFYIPSRQMFLELNAHWSHGYHWFGGNADEAKLKVLSQKAVGSDYYANVVHVWTVADVRKRECARENNLNYVVFWRNDLLDAKCWFEHGCPDSHDWKREYDWFYGLNK